MGGVREIIRGIKKELGEKVKVVATGGLGILLAEECEEIDEVNSTLTLQGLNFIGEKWA
ncbi:Type III pantothenate kinase [subsurface metagenome]